MIKFESEKHFENYLKEYLPKLLPQKFPPDTDEDWVETYMLTIDHSRVMLQEVKGWFRSNSRHDFSFVEQQFLLNSEGK